MCRVLGSDEQDLQLHDNVKISNDKILNRLLHVLYMYCTHTAGLPMYVRNFHCKMFPSQTKIVTHV